MNVISHFATRIANVVAALTLSLTLLSAGAHAADPAPAIAWRKDYATALRDAAKLKRPVFLQISAEWCGYCRKMQGDTFLDARVVEQINRSFVPVKIDADLDRRLVRAFHPASLPTTVIIAPDLKILDRLIGYQAAETLVTQLVPFEPVLVKASEPAEVIVERLEPHSDTVSITKTKP
jgi:thiol:disulfide interchange protein